MQPDVMNMGAAILLGFGIFGMFIAGRGLIAWGWLQMDSETKEKVNDVITFVLNPEADPVDVLSLVVFGNLTLAAALAAVGLQASSIIIFLALVMALPVMLYYRASGQRARELELALPLALQQVANEMAAGATLETALKKVARTAPQPADVEIAKLQRRVEVMGIDQAFAEMAERLDSRSFALTASVVRVGTSSGGRLIEALKSLSRTLIEIERLNKKIRTASENGRRNIYLMSFIGPIVAIGAGAVVDHETSVLADGMGQLLIGIAVLAFVAAHVFGHILTKAKV